MLPGSESPNGPHEECVVFRNFDDERRFEIHVRGVCRLFILFGRREIVDQPIHSFSTVFFQRIVESVAGLPVVFHARTAVVVVADGHYFVDGGQIPSLALIAAPFECRKIGP